MNLKIAIPTVNNKLTAHFGHCEKFAIVEIKENEIANEIFVEPPVHQPGVYPQFLANLGVDVIIAGGIGQKAKDLFAMNNIQVFTGVMDGSPSGLAMDYLNNQLETGMNLCDH